MTYNIPVRPEIFTERFINHLLHCLSHFPHEIKTRYHAVLLYRSGRYSIKYVTRKYHISKSSLMRWNKVFDGSKESLLDRSHRPHTPHPNSHTSEEIKKIVDLMKRNPDIGLNELFSKLRLSIGYAILSASITGSKPMATMALSRSNRHPIRLSPIKLTND